MGHRVVVAGGRRLGRESLGALLTAADVEVVATCGDVTSLLAAVDQHEPDVVITHVFLGAAGAGATVTTRLRAERPTLGVVLLLGLGDPTEVAQVLEEGTQRRALLMRDHPRIARDLVAAVREVADGGSVVHPGVVDLVLRAVRERTDALADLTGREETVLAEIASGASNAGVAAALGLSERAVEKHITQLYAKLDLPTDRKAHRRVQAVLAYLAARGY
jgi:DNA-binding NarL/FixJ family response regulator